MVGWKKSRGALGPLRPLIGAWTSEAAAEGPASAAPCRRVFRPFGAAWIELVAHWDTGGEGYREIALFGRGGGPELAFWSFTADGKRSQGRLTDGRDVHPEAIAFEADMPAGIARMVYWPTEEGEGFYFSVESKTRAGWNRFLRHRYRPQQPG